jgi:hypothetical protein
VGVRFFAGLARPKTDPLMTKITPIAVDIRLAAENNFVDLILLQWWSTPPIPNQHRWQVVNDSELSFKKAVLALLTEWIRQTNRRSRPLFIVAPENSIPDELVDVIDSLMATVSNCVFIGGLVPLKAADYSTYHPAFKRPLIDDDGLLVNAVGIWIRPYSGNSMDCYLQVKRHLAAQEELNFTKGDELWLFENRERRGLTFFCSICADFTADTKVTDLLSVFDDGRPSAVDLGFIVMMNPHRDAKEFARAATAYFSRSSTDTPYTDRSALVYLNNPSPGPESRHFGASEIAFRYREVAPTAEIVKPTFSFGPSEGHYRALLRDNEPSIYYLRWQPLRLTDGGPGSDDPQVFELAQHLSLRECPAVVRFRNLPAVHHWLSSTWRAACADSENYARQNFICETSACQAPNDWSDLWQKAVAWWTQQLGDNDTIPVRILKLFDEQRFSPKSAGSHEPANWEPEFTWAISRIPEAFLILILISGQSATLSDREAEHLRVGHWGIAFVYAQNRKNFVATWRAFRDHAQRVVTSPARLLAVIIDSRGPQWHSCRRLPEERDITLGTSPGITAPPPVTVVPTCTDSLLNRLVMDYSTGKGEIKKLVNNLFEDCTCTC